MPKSKRTSSEPESSTQAMDVGEDAEGRTLDEPPPPSAAAASDQPPAKRAKKAKAPVRSGSAQAHENGVIRSIILTNFMNHKHLKVDFDPHVNFIVGKNGSGKSAIVNALIAGFGHRAQETGRKMTTSKNLIMNGKDVATIQVVLANGGEDPFKPEEFGDTIVAQHTLERNGPGSYKLKDGEDGAYRRSTKGEFELLCAHFNIQANNPCALLTQEHAKKFLHKGDAEARYRFFLQAANLDSRKNDLNATMQNVELLKHRLARAEEGMADKREVARKAQAEFEGASKLRELNQRLEEFEPMLGWALVGQKEDELDAEKKELVEAQEAEKQALNDAETAKERLLAIEKDVADKERAFRNLSDKVAEFAKRAEREGGAFKEAGKALKRKKREVAAMGEQLEDVEAGLAETSAQYEEASGALAQNQDRAARQRREKREAAARRVLEAEEAEKAAQGAVDATWAEEKDAVAARTAAEDAERGAASEVATKEASAKEANKGAFNLLHNLHPDMAELVRRIEENASRFEVPPLGPLGRNVRIRPGMGRLAPAAELALGRDLITFLVGSHHDENLLHQLKRDVSKKGVTKMARPDQTLAKMSRIIVTKFSEPRFQISAKEGQEGAEGGGEDAGGGGGGGGRRRASKGGVSGTGGGGLKRLADVVEITAPDTPIGAGGQGGPSRGKARASGGGDGGGPTQADAWYNFLCNYKSFEQMYVSDQFEEMRETIVSAPGDAMGIFCLAYGEHGQRVAKKASWRTVKEANDHVEKQRQTLVESKETMVASLKAEVALARSEHGKRKAERDAAVAETRRLEAALKGQRKALKEVTAAHVAALDEQAALADASGGDEAERELDELLQRREALARDASTLKADLARTREEIEEDEAQLAPRREKIEEMASKYEKMIIQQNELEEALNEAKAPLQKSKVSQTGSRRSVHAAQEAQREHREKVTKLEEHLRAIVPQVENAFGERVLDPKRRSVAQLKQEQQRLQKQIEAQAKKHGGKDYEQLSEEMRKSKAIVDAADKDMAIVRDMGEKEEKAFAERSRFFKKEAKSKGVNAGADFNQRLTQRGHAGKLTFDHDRETLDLEVVRNNQDVNAKATGDARALSGGERSFTTLAFEIAMWEFCQTPFRVLDEFDVYMDDTYRKQAVDTLLDLCDCQVGRQFIFLTPQDMYPFLESRDGGGKAMPKIIRMNDVR